MVEVTVAVVVDPEETGVVLCIGVDRIFPCVTLKKLNISRYQFHVTKNNPMLLLKIVNHLKL